MKALFIGGTGTISSYVSKLALKQGWKLVLLNRGNQPLPEGAEEIRADIHDEEAVRSLISGQNFDVVVDFIAFIPEDVQRDVRLFEGKTRQYLFISSASAYQKAPGDYMITESTPLANPYWKYSRDKIACEEYLMNCYREKAFPVTIIRPSHTYCETGLPVGMHGPAGSWPIVRRMQEGKPVIIHGDGTSLWTMTHSRDVAKGIVGLMGNIHAIGNAYHITSDESLTWNQIYQTVAAQLGVTLNAVHIPTDFLVACSSTEEQAGLLGDKMHSVVFDNSKIKRAVPGFCATTRFDQSVAEVLDYLMSHPEKQVVDTEYETWYNRVIATYENAISSFQK